MKRNVLMWAAILLSLLVGCAKEDDGTTGNEYYFRFKVDGKQQEYAYGDNQVNLIASSTYNEKLGVYSINISGVKNIFESGTNTLTVLISDSKGVSPGVNYSNIPGEGDDYPDFIFSMGYYNNEGNLYISGGAGDSPVFDLYEPAFIEFTEITESYISGTFSGKLIWYDSSNGTNVFVDDLVISEGKFKVQRL